MIKTLTILGVVLFVLWGSSTAWELMERETGESISIVGQLFFNVGVPSLIFFLVLLWFLKSSGLDKLPEFMTGMDKHMEDIKASIKSAGEGGKSGGSDA